MIWIIWLITFQTAFAIGAIVDLQKSFFEHNFQEKQKRDARGRFIR